MSSWHGYTGKILNVDLSASNISETELDRSLAEDFMGGKGFGAKIFPMK